MSTPRTRRHARERVEVEPERVRSGRLGGVPPQLADPSEAVAGLDALHVGEHLGRDIQVRIEGGTVRIERLYAVPELHGDDAGRRVGVVAPPGVAFTFPRRDWRFFPIWFFLTG